MAVKLTATKKYINLGGHIILFLTYYKVFLLDYLEKNVLNKQELSPFKGKNTCRWGLYDMKAKRKIPSHMYVILNIKLYGNIHMLI